MLGLLVWGDWLRVGDPPVVVLGLVEREVEGGGALRNGEKGLAVVGGVGEILCVGGGVGFIIHKLRPCSLCHLNLCLAYFTVEYVSLSSTIEAETEPAIQEGRCGDNIKLIISTLDL